MAAYKISKYNPTANSTAKYNGWTDFYSFLKCNNSDISKIKEYTDVEDQYVNCILNFLETFGLSELVLQDANDFRDEEWAQDYLVGLERVNFKITSRYLVSEKNFSVVFRLLLRGLLVGRLYSTDGTKAIYIDEDMYLFLVVPETENLNFQKVNCRSLHVEEYPEKWL